jgi:hypothetical protein
MDYPLYGHPPGNATAPNQARNAPSTWPWWVYLVGILVILLVVLTCTAIGMGIYAWYSQRRIQKEAQRPAEREAVERGEAEIGNGTAKDGTANDALRVLRRDPSPPKAITTQPGAAPAVEVWGIDAELSEDGSSWRISTITAWVNDIPEGTGPDMADLETQLFRARQCEELWMARGRRLKRPKVTFASNLARRELVSDYIDR